MPQGCLQFVIVIFPDHTRLLFLILYRFIANSSSCTSTEHCKLLTSCLTAVYFTPLNFHRFIANYSSCTTTGLSKLLTSCLTAVKNVLPRTVKRFMRELVEIYFVLLIIQVKF